jgi:hypothetical protein
LIDLVLLLVRYPKVGVPIVLVLVVFGIVAGRRAQSARVSSVILEGGRAASLARQQALRAALVRLDARFDDAAFFARVRTAFVAVQEGWCGHRPERFRAFVSDGVHERFALQIDEQKALGYRDAMEEIEVAEVTLADLVSEGAFDALTVRIAASARDYRVRIEDQAFLSGSRSREPFAEFWSFVRRRGATTKPGAPGLIEGSCPNCGGPVGGEAGATCPHCKTWLRDGRLDWVLAEITQAVEWRGGGRETPPGVDDLRGGDPDLDVQDLEDRASVFFWRRATAQRTGDADLLRRSSTPAFFDRFEGDLRADQAAPSRRWDGECAVGGVETLGVVRQPGADRALVEIAWQGTPFTFEKATADGVPRREPRSPIARSTFVLARKPGSVTRIEEALSSAHCPGCGAPDLGGATAACEFCGTVRVEGDRGWLLEDVLERGDPKRAALVAALPGGARPRVAVVATAGGRLGNLGLRPGIGEATVAWAVSAALADETIDDAERATLARLARKAGVAPARVEELIAEAGSPGFAPPGPVDAREARVFVERMADAALADGDVSAKEMRMLVSLGATQGLAPLDVRMIVGEVRGLRYRQAKAAIDDAEDGSEEEGDES